MTQKDTLEITSKSLEKVAERIINESHNSSIWDTIIPILIGSFVTLIAQFAIEYWKTRNETSDKRRELVAKSNAKTYLIAQILKDLAMFKVHKKYYYQASLSADKKSEMEDCYKKHYEKGQDQRLTEVKLDESITEYIQIVNEYVILTKNRQDFETHFKAIAEYKHPTSETFKGCDTQKKRIEKLKSEEIRLNKEYENFNKLFSEIQKLIK